ncbi:MAG: DcrB-related protein [Anaerolineaceae bacterium]|nr:DcrB-related protein [Anaerolineaceae bacterium]
MNSRRAILALVTLCMLAALAACGGQTASPVPDEPTATADLEPTATVDLEPTATPESTPPGADTPAPTGTRVSRTYLTYESEANGFSIDYPDEWEISERASMPGTATFITPLQGADDTFRENVTVVVQGAPADATTLDEFTEMALAQGRELIPRFMVMESRSATLAGNPAQQVVYTGLQGERDLRWLQLWSLVGDQVYILTYTAEENEFTTFRSVVQQMITSMEIR